MSHCLLGSNHMLMFSLFAGKKVKLSLAAEEVALFFAQMLDHEYTTKKVFRENFFKDWRKVKQADT